MKYTIAWVPDDAPLPGVRFGQRWSLPDGLEVAVLDVVTPRFIGRREDGVRVVGECSDLRKHGKLVVDAPQRSDREMVANTVYREAEFPPDGMTKKAWLAQMVRHTESRPGFRARTHWEFCADAIGCQLSSWRGALELTWPAPVVAPVEPVKVEPVAERPAVRVGQVWRDGPQAYATAWTMVEDFGHGRWRMRAVRHDREYTGIIPDSWQLVRDVEAPKPALSRKVEVGQVWRCVNTGEVARIELVDGLLAVFAGRDRCVSMVLMADGTPEYEHWERVS